MNEMSLQPTVVQEVRGFLLGAGLPQRPWSGAMEVLQALTVLLDERKDDPEFSGALEELLARLDHLRRYGSVSLRCTGGRLFPGS